MQPEDLAQKAMQALNEGDGEGARGLLQQAIEAADGPRADLLQAMGVVQLQLGDSSNAGVTLRRALDLAWEANADPEFLVQTTLSLAAAHEDEDAPSKALDAYEQVSELDATNPRGRSGRASLLLAWGRLDEGLAELDQYLEEAIDPEDFLEGATALAAAVRAFLADERSPEELLTAHRDSYVEFFDETASEMAKQGWIAECARMRRADDGSLELSIPEEARPYAGVRVDLVDPSSGQAGQVGDQPMVVALAGLEPLARAPVTFDWEGAAPFRVRVSTQSPWDQLPIQVLFEEEGGDHSLDGEIGSWYKRGFDGHFGDKEAGRFHYISDPAIIRGGRGVCYHVDLGRAKRGAIDALIRDLRRLHRRRPIAGVLLGRGHL